MHNCTRLRFVLTKPVQPGLGRAAQKHRRWRVRLTKKTTKVLWLVSVDMKVSHSVITTPSTLFSR